LPQIRVALMRGKRGPALRWGRRKGRGEEDIDKQGRGGGKGDMYRRTESGKKRNCPLTSISGKKEEKDVAGSLTMGEEERSEAIVSLARGKGKVAKCAEEKKEKKDIESYCRSVPLP